ncbi:MAG: hypothetical protein R3D98_11400 [Candidatus Krumholzibacteriia bacterium]
MSGSEARTTNSTNIPPADRRYGLEELWRRGAEDDDLLFGVIGDLDVAVDGVRLYLYDQQRKMVLVLDQEGEYFSSGVIEGEAPGQVAQPNSLVAS